MFFRVGTPKVYHGAQIHDETIKNNAKDWTNYLKNIGERLELSAVLYYFTAQQATPHANILERSGAPSNANPRTA